MGGFRHPPRRNGSSQKSGKGKGKEPRTFVFLDRKSPECGFLENMWRSICTVSDLWNPKYGELVCLLREVVKNGYGKDLTFYKNDKKHIKKMEKFILNCDDPSKLTENWQEIPIIYSVDLLMDHPIHISMGRPLNWGEMLAIVLYTGCDLTYGFSNDMRSYGAAPIWKWRFFCQSLHYAVLCLWEASESEKIDMKTIVYSGLEGTVVENHEIDNFWFKTFVSWSVDKKVAASFKGGVQTSGIVFESPLESLFFLAADVSWISRFPHEKEMLMTPNNFPNTGKTGKGKARVDKEKSKEDHQTVVYL